MLGVMTNLQNRGLVDILIACIDGLNGFLEAIAEMFPKTEVQSCIVHQIRNSLKYVGSKDQWEFMSDLKPVYQAVSKEMAENELEKLSEKWQKKYSVVIDSCHKNWEK
jgi:putative transposase